MAEWQHSRALSCVADSLSFILCASKELESEINERFEPKQFQLLERNTVEGVGEYRKFSFAGLGGQPDITECV